MMLNIPLIGLFVSVLSLVRGEIPFLAVPAEGSSYVGGYNSVSSPSYSNSLSNYGPPLISSFGALTQNCQPQVRTVEKIIYKDRSGHFNLFRLLFSPYFQL